MLNGCKPLIIRNKITPFVLFKNIGENVCKMKIWTSKLRFIELPQIFKPTIDFLKLWIPVWLKVKSSLNEAHRILDLNLILCRDFSKTPSISCLKLYSNWWTQESKLLLEIFGYFKNQFVDFVKYLYWCAWNNLL